VRLGSVTAQHSSSGRQPNSAALKRRCHLYSAGRPSSWALAHILVDMWFNRAKLVFVCVQLTEADTRCVRRDRVVNGCGKIYFTRVLFILLFV